MRPSSCPSRACCSGFSSSPSACPSTSARWPPTCPRSPATSSSLMALKAAALFALCLLFGIGRATAIRAALLSQFGEFGFVLFSAALAAGLIGPGLFAVVIAGIAISMLATPPMARLEAIGWRRASRRPPRRRSWRTPPRRRCRSAPGCGGRLRRVGASSATCWGGAALPRLRPRPRSGPRRPGARPQRPLGRHAQLRPAARRPGEAAALVVTFGRARRGAPADRRRQAAFPGIAIHARARDLGSRHALLAAGVKGAVPEVAEASLSMGNSTKPSNT